MSLDTSGKQFSTDRVLLSVKAHGLQKQLASELGMSDGDLSKLLNDQLPKIGRLLDVLGLEIVRKGHVAELRSVLKEVL